jgi:ribosomal protein S1
VDDVVEGKVIGIEKSGVYIDIPPFGTGIIYGREYINARDIIKKINVGDSVLLEKLFHLETKTAT